MDLVLGEISKSPDSPPDSPWASPWARPGRTSSLTESNTLASRDLWDWTCLVLSIILATASIFCKASFRLSSRAAKVLTLSVSCLFSISISLSAFTSGSMTFESGILRNLLSIFLCLAAIISRTLSLALLLAFPMLTSWIASLISSIISACFMEASSKSIILPSTKSLSWAPSETFSFWICFKTSDCFCIAASIFFIFSIDFIDFINCSIRICCFFCASSKMFCLWRVWSIWSSLPTSVLNPAIPLDSLLSSLPDKMFDIVPSGSKLTRICFEFVAPSDFWGIMIICGDLELLIMFVLVLSVAWGDTNPSRSEPGPTTTRGVLVLGLLGLFLLLFDLSSNVFAGLASGLAVVVTWSGDVLLPAGRSGLNLSLGLLLLLFSSDKSSVSVRTGWMLLSRNWLTLE